MKPNLFPSVAYVAVALAVVGCKKSSDTTQTDASSPGTAVSTAAKGDPNEAATLKLRWRVGGRFEHRMQVAQLMQIPAMPGFPGSRPTTQEVAMGQDYALNVLRERPG